MHIELLSFLRTGMFGPIELGMTKQQVKSIFGKPQYWGGSSYCEGQVENKGRIDRRTRSYWNYPIWLYDHMEFHFGCEQQLFLIYCDHLDWLILQGKVFSLDLWIFEQNRHISKDQFLQALSDEHISFHETISQYTGSIQLPSGVEIIYERDGTDEVITVCNSNNSFIK